MFPPVSGTANLCDEAYRNLQEFWREDTLLFARPGDVFHSDRADLLHDYVRRAELGAREARAAADARGEVATAEAVRRTSTLAAQAAFPADMSWSERRRIRRAAKRLRVHPTQPGWFLSCSVASDGTETWRAVPPLNYRWELIGAYHDRLGHAGEDMPTSPTRLCSTHNALSGACARV